MELQCKERVDLLEALKLSRQEDKKGEDPSRSTSAISNGKLSKIKTPRQSSESDRAEKGYIGEGSIPAVSLPDISRLAPKLPQRPKPPRNKSDRAATGRTTSSSTITQSSLQPTNHTAPTLAPPGQKSSRSPSPDKGRTMRTTLRSGGQERKAPSKTLNPTVTSPPVPSKAATLAWTTASRSGRDGLGRSLENDLTSSTPALDGSRKYSYGGASERPTSSHQDVYYDSKTRTLVTDHPKAAASPIDLLTGKSDLYNLTGRNNSYPFPPTDPGQPGAVAGSMQTPSDLIDLYSSSPMNEPQRRNPRPEVPQAFSHKPPTFEPISYPTYLREYPETTAKKENAANQNLLPLRRRSPAKAHTSSEAKRTQRKAVGSDSPQRRHAEMSTIRAGPGRRKPGDEDVSSQSLDDDTNESEGVTSKPKKRSKQKGTPILADPTTPTSDDTSEVADTDGKDPWEKKVAHLLKHLPKGVDDAAAKQIINEIVVMGDEVHWDDVAGLDVAKSALKEAVVYPFLRPDLFMGLREPARGMLLFGPPGTGKTMLARAVATESRSTFFSISASSLTSKYLGESEKLVRALFALAKALAPSIIFVDEIDSLLSARSGSGENEATRRIKTEFLIQWSDLQRAAAGREQSKEEKERGDASRVLVLAATNLPWAIDEAARRRFVRRQYIPLPEDVTREKQLQRLLGHQKHSLSDNDIQDLVKLTDGS